MSIWPDEANFLNSQVNTIHLKFVDDLTVLEIVNVLTIGLSSFNLKLQIPTDIPCHNQLIHPQNLQSQNWLDQINEWTRNQKMLINEKKTKTLIFNFTDNYKFTTRLQLNNDTVEVINSTKLLGTIIQDDLKTLSPLLGK